MRKKQWRYRTFTNEDGERYVLREITNKNKLGNRPLNFWVIKNDDVALYTFEVNSEYNPYSLWSEDLFKKLLDDLRSPNPTVKVLRYVYNGVIVYTADNYLSCEIPKTPTEPERPEGWEIHLEKKKKKAARKEIERIKGNEIAPFILYGKHEGNDKEFAWSLTPDKPKRQGIVPGDRVLVWTKRGFQEVTAIRIEEAQDGVEQPTARVKKKL